VADAKAQNCIISRKNAKYLLLPLNKKNRQMWFSGVFYRAKDLGPSFRLR